MEYKQLQPIILVAGVFVHTLVAGAIAFAAPFFNKIPYHTSILTGEGFINGHPKHIQSELGVRLHVFRHLVTALKVAGVTEDENWSRKHENGNLKDRCGKLANEIAE
jgi:hypothetical protein